MLIIEPQFLRMKEVQEILERTDAEKKALNKYQGNNGSNMINELLGNYMTDHPVRGVKEEIGFGRYKYYSYYENQKETPEQVISGIMDQIQDIYSALVKSTYTRGDSSRYTREFYRGSAHSLLGKNLPAFISTTESEREGCMWAVSNNKDANHHILSYVSVEGDVPYTFMPHSANEDEVLISPFVELEDNRQQGYSPTYGEFSGLTFKKEYVKVHYKKPQMLSPEKIEEVQAELLSKAKTFSTLTDKSIELSREIEKMNDRIARIEKEWGSSDSEVISLKSQRDSKKAEYDSANTYISDYKKQFRLLMEGRCAAVEQRIEQQINQEIQAREEKKKTVIVEQPVQGNMTTLEEDAKRANEIKSKYSQSYNFGKNNVDLRNRKAILDQIKRETGISFASPLESVLGYALQANFAISRLNHVSDENWTFLNQDDVLSRLSAEEIKMIGQDTDEEFKRRIALEVLKIRGAHQIQTMEHMIQEKTNEKLGLLGGFGKKKKEHDLQLENMKKQLAQYNDQFSELLRNGVNSNYTFRARDLMAEISIGRELATSDTERNSYNLLERALTRAFKISQKGIEESRKEKLHYYQQPNGIDYFFRGYQDSISHVRIQERKVNPIEQKVARDAQEIIRRCNEEHNKYTSINHDQIQDR